MKMKRTIIAGAGWCAVIEDGRLMEYIPSGTESVSGSILTGRVGRLMPGMNCAFIEIGRKKNGFLPLDEESNSFTGGPVRSGETLLLQIKKEETGEKGAFLTRDITLAGSLVIVMPMNRYIGVSGRIKEEAVRDQLKQTGTKIAGGRFGLVMRNAAEGADENEIRAEAETLFVRWKEIERQAAQSLKPGTVFNQDNPLERLKADYVSGGYEIAEETGEPGPEIKRQLKEASERTLRLPGGGNIVIDRCEAMTVIDVNTASFAGAGSKERSVTETNLEACALIAQQVRLRNLGGIILIDFIDMETERDRSLVSGRLAECFAADRIKTVLHGWTKLGIMEMTRKRSGKELNS